MYLLCESTVYLRSDHHIFICISKISYKTTINPSTNTKYPIDFACACQKFKQVILYDKTGLKCNLWCKKIFISTLKTFLQTTTSYEIHRQEKIFWNIILINIQNQRNLLLWIFYLPLLKMTWRGTILLIVNNWIRIWNYTIIVFSK